MPKQNQFIANMEQKFARKYALMLAQAKQGYESQLNLMLQMCSDAATITYGQVMEDEAQPTPIQFCKAYGDNVKAMLKLFAEDDASDKSLDYSVGTIDNELKRYVGDENFVDWDGRYAHCARIKVQEETAE